MLSRRELLAAGAAFSVFGCKERPQKSLVIGGVLPLTGDGSTYGVAASNGAKLAVEIFNRSAGNAPVARWVPEDSRGDPVAAATAARKLLDVDGAAALIGDVTSAGTHAIVPIATRAKVPLVSPAASDPALTGVSPFFARVWPSDEFETGVLANYAAQRGYGRIAALYSNDDYGAGFFRGFRKAASNRIAFSAAFPPNASDFRPLIRRVRSAGADAVLLVSLPERGRLLLTQMSEAGVKLPVLATASIEDPQIASLRNASSITFASPAPVDPNTSARRRFETEYRRAYRSDPSVLADTGYDAANLLIAAWKENPDAGAMMQWIRGRRDYDGASGRMSFSPQGDVVKRYRLKRGGPKGFEWV